MNTEPAAVIGTATAVVAALIALLVSFGVDISDDQQNAILALVGVAAPIVAGVLIRRKVTPV
jgi:hypothetical protein